MSDQITPNVPEAPIPREFGPEDVIAISSMIRYISDIEQIDPDSVRDSDVRALTPDLLRLGLYVPEDGRDAQHKHAQGGVIFPPEQYHHLTISPRRVAVKAANDVWKSQPDAPDKQELEKRANEEAAKALNEMLRRSQNLMDALQVQEDFLGEIVSELEGARGTGFFAHYHSADLKIKLAEAETSIFDALNVTAITRSWDRETYARAKRTLTYQLFGQHDARFKNWKEYGAMAAEYANRRRRIIENTQLPIRSELRKYPQPTDEK